MSSSSNSGPSLCWSDYAAGHDGDFAHYTSILVVLPTRHLSIAVLATGDMPDPRLKVRQLLPALA
jgi:hypothetical protein